MLAAGAMPALAEPVAYECAIRYIVTDTSATPAKSSARVEGFTIDEARGIGCIMSGGFCNPLYSRLKVSRTGDILFGAGTMLIGGNSVTVTFHPNAGRATVAYTFVSLAEPSQDTHISGPGDCRRLATAPDLDHLF